MMGYKLLRTQESLKIKNGKGIKVPGWCPSLPLPNKLLKAMQNRLPYSLKTEAAQKV